MTPIQQLAREVISALLLRGEIIEGDFDLGEYQEIIDILVATDIQGDTARQFYNDFLKDPEAQVRQSAIAGLVRLSEVND